MTDVLQRARLKRSLGEPLSVREERALAKEEARLEEVVLRRVIGRVPQRIFREWAGRQNNQIYQQAVRYRMPPDAIGRTVDVPKLIAWLYDFLAVHARKLVDQAETPEDATLRRKRDAEARLAELRVEEALGRLIARDQLHETCDRVGDRLRKVGETLGRQCGPEAAEIFNHGLSDVQLFLDQLFATSG